MFPPAKKSILSRLMRSEKERSFAHPSEQDRDILFALGELRAWEDTHEGSVSIGEQELRTSHDAIAALTSGAAKALGFDPDLHLTLSTDVEGSITSTNFRLSYIWREDGVAVRPKRTGAILATSRGAKRLPLWIKQALDLADSDTRKMGEDERWRVLADFRRMLEPDAQIPSQMPENREMAGLAMSGFLKGLTVRIANQFSIAPDKGLGQFEVIPFSSERLATEAPTDGQVQESNSELSGEQLAEFQFRLRSRGARPAYQLQGNTYLVVDQSVAPVLEEMVRAQNADREERRAFIQNPRAFITEAVTKHLERSADFKELDPAEQEELIESIAAPAFVETREYSDRVLGTTIYVKPAQAYESSGTAWLPEVFTSAVLEAIEGMDDDALRGVVVEMERTLKAGTAEAVDVAGHPVEATPERVVALNAELDAREERREAGAQEEEETGAADGPIILDTLDNYDEVAWHARLAPRIAVIPATVPESITTPLRLHQVESFDWSTQAWKQGLPGILNADEQGLGKTLQTITFLNWLQGNMREGPENHRRPILVVAPTSLLRNWEAEVETHVTKRKFGQCIRLYGSHLAGFKKRGSRGKETQSGLPNLDLDWLDEAIEEGRADRFWILTTYTTLANYQHSLGSIRFAAMVMDEIQNIKNKDTIASKAAEAMNADFRLGLTGTPIENSTMDLWTVMDRIAPGYLGSGRAFRDAYGVPNEDNMTDLHARVFKPQSGYAPLGIRRLKDDVAKDLPSKTRRLHPGFMPEIQATTYDVARAKLAAGGAGAALKMLQHIRSVSVHPNAASQSDPDEFTRMSVRLSKTMEILRKIAQRGERALVFIENRDMQFKFVELVKYYFALEQVDVINGDTPINKRQAIVNRFQRHLMADDGFDLLVLGPKAAGTGLTLTAATHVIHLSRWWNPAVEEQCNDRVHRIGQQRPVEVHVPLAIHRGYGAQSFDCLLQSLMQRKRRMANQALWPMGDTKGDLDGLQGSLDDGVKSDGSKTLHAVMQEQFDRDGMKQVEPGPDGSYAIP
ncbi:DEAD/DEAH box helicase [Maritimibacter sp. DP1N21-5]|nr:DEAD/DEAH box helicase [Maritimibacter sp. DP1N21-5]